MVSYQKFTSLCFQAAKQKGIKFSGIEDGGNFTSQIAEYWNANKDRLKQMTVAQARQEAEDIVEA